MKTSAAMCLTAKHVLSHLGHAWLLNTFLHSFSGYAASMPASQYANF